MLISQNNSKPNFTFWKSLIEDSLKCKINSKVKESESKYYFYYTFLVNRYRYTLSVPKLGTFSNKRTNHRTSSLTKVDFLNKTKRIEFNN